MNKIFIDSDVVIDFLVDREPFANNSSIIFGLADNKEIEIWASALCVSNVHYVIRKILGDKKAKEVIKELLELIEIQAVSKNEIMEALNADFKDFEDSIQHSTACTIKGIEAIVTRNTKDYKKSKLAVFSPATYLKTQKTRGLNL